MSSDEKSADEALRTFCSVTGRDEPYAHFMLQDVDYDLNAALQLHFDREGTGDSRQSQTKTGGGSSSSTAAAEKKPKLEENEEKVQFNDIGAFFGGSGKSSSRQDRPALSLLTWNIDGINPSARQIRCRAVVQLIQLHNPDVVFLQEVVEDHEPILARLSGKYQIHYSRDPQAPRIGGEYYTAILLSLAVTIDRHIVDPFSGSMMSRGLQIVECRLGGEKRVILYNTHLESTKDAAPAHERRRQLRIVFDKLLADSQRDRDAFLIFGGDLNVREPELPVDKIEAARAFDVWEMAGRPSSARYTWDRAVNANCGGTLSHVRLRFDRVFVVNPMTHDVRLELIGRQTIKGPLVHPSDHFGLLVHLFLA